MGANSKFSRGSLPPEFEKKAAVRRRARARLWKAMVRRGIVFPSFSKVKQVLEDRDYFHIQDQGIHITFRGLAKIWRHIFPKPVRGGK